MSIRPGRAKGPWVGFSGAGSSLTEKPGQGIVYQTAGGATELNALAGFHDFFEYPDLKPFWQDTEVITSADWQLDAANDTLDGIAQNNTYDTFREGIEGDLDYSMKFDRNGGTSCGFYFHNVNETSVVRAGQSTTAGGEIFLEVTGFANISVANTDSPIWIRVTRFENLWTAYYKVNDTDAWTELGSRTIDLGNKVKASLDSCTNAEIFEVHFYDNMFPERVQADAGKEVELTDAATIIVDASRANTFRVTLGGNRTMGAPSNPLKNQKIIFKIYQDGTGNRTLTWNAIFRFSTDIPSPTLSTAAGALDYVGFIYNEADVKWDCIALVQGF